MFYKYKEETFFKGRNNIAIMFGLFLFPSVCFTQRQMLPDTNENATKCLSAFTEMSKLRWCGGEAYPPEEPCEREGTNPAEAAICLEMIQPYAMWRRG